MAPTPRAHEPWEHQEYLQLVDELVADTGVAEMAEARGRTITAITSKIADLVPPDADTPRRIVARKEWLRDQLASGALDWQQALRENTDSYSRYWSPEDDAYLRQAWEAGRPGLEELAFQLLTQAFAPADLTETLTAMSEADGSNDDAALATAKEALHSCGQRLLRYRAALEAGTDRYSSSSGPPRSRPNPSGPRPRFAS